MAEVLEQVIQRYGLALCVDCGKCVAVCPMGEIFDDFCYEISPRGVIEAVLIEGEAALLEASQLWFCLPCDQCSSLCPAGVRFRDFVEASRLQALQRGVREHAQFCRGCGSYLWPTHTVGYLKRKLGETAGDTLTLCPRCRRYAFGAKAKAQLPGSRRPHPNPVEVP
jgi:heterodisulfide reductase subunit C